MLLSKLISGEVNASTLLYKANFLEFQLSAPDTLSFSVLLLTPVTI